MANTYQSISSGLAELKNFYQGPIVDLISEEIPVYRAAEKVKQGWSGYQVIRPLRTNRNQGIGATTDGGTLPKIGAQTVKQAIIAAKFNYLRFGITGPMIKASQSDVGSFVRSAAYELQMGYQDLKTNLNRQLNFDGTGTIAQTNTAAAASNTLVIKGRTTGEPALKYVDVSTTFDILSSAGALKVSGVTVNSISSGTGSSATATLILDQAVTSASGDILVLAGSYNNEIQGIYAALDGGTTTVYNIDRSAVISYQGNYSDISSNAVTQLTIDAMQNPFNEGLRRGNVGSYNAVFTDHTTLRYYQKLLVPDKRYTSMEGDGTFGSKGKFYLDFNGIPVVPDKDSPTRIAFLPAEVLKLYELCAMEFADEQGTMYIAQSDSDTYEVRLRHKRCGPSDGETIH